MQWVGVKSPSTVGPEEVAAAAMVAEVGWDIKSIFVVVVVGPQALLQLRRFIKYRATLCMVRGGGFELLPLCSIAIYSFQHTRVHMEK